MRCKCRQCQTNLNTQDAYKTTINNRNAYFCNEEHYEKFLQTEEDKKKVKQLHDRVCELFAEILGVTQITNTALYKEKAELNAVYSDEVIISYLEENKEWIVTSVAKLTGNTYGKIRYVSVILRNKLGDYRPKTVVKEDKPTTVESKVELDTRDDVGLRTNKKKKTTRRRGFAEMED